MNPKRKSSDKLRRRSNGKRKSGENLVIIDEIPNPKSYRGLRTLAPMPKPKTILMGLISELNPGGFCLRSDRHLWKKCGICSGKRTFSSLRRSAISLERWTESGTWFHQIPACIMVSTTFQGHVLALTESSPENITPEWLAQKASSSEPLASGATSPELLAFWSPSPEITSSRHH